MTILDPMIPESAWLACVDNRPRWRRRVDDFRRNNRIVQWGFWPAFWFRVHSWFNHVCFGEGWGSSDWGHDHVSIMAIHRWLCRRWVPANERYMARLRPL